MVNDYFPMIFHQKMVHVWADPHLLDGPSSMQRPRKNSPATNGSRASRKREERRQAAPIVLGSRPPATQCGARSFFIIDIHRCTQMELEFTNL